MSIYSSSEVLQQRVALEGPGQVSERKRQKRANNEKQKRCHSSLSIEEPQATLGRTGVGGGRFISSPSLPMQPFTCDLDGGASWKATGSSFLGVGLGVGGFRRSKRVLSPAPALEVLPRKICLVQLHLFFFFFF